MEIILLFNIFSDLNIELKIMFFLFNNNIYCNTLKYYGICSPTQNHNTNDSEYQTVACNVFQNFIYFQSILLLRFFSPA